jgi:hypothetical protein
VWADVKKGLGVETWHGNFWLAIDDSAEKGELARADITHYASFFLLFETLAQCQELLC